MALGNLGLIAYWFLNYLSGYALYRFVFRKSNTLELFIIPQIIGLFMLPFLFTISYFTVGFGASLYLAPVLAVLSSVISFKIPQEVSREKNVDKRLVLVMLAFLIPVSYSFMSSSIFTASADSTFYQTATNHIKNFRTLPPEMGCLSGEVYHYPWFFNLSIALQQILSGLSIIDAHPFYAIYASAIFLLAALLLGKEHSGKDSLGVVYVGFIGLYLYGSMLAASPTVYVFPLIIFFIFCLSRYLKTNDKKTGVLAGVSAGATMYIHGLSFVFVLLVFFAYTLRKALEFDKESLKSLIYPAAGLSTSIPYILFIKGKALSAFVLLPFGGITIFNLLGAIGIVFLAFSFLSLKQKLSETRKIFFYAILLIFIFTNVFVMKQSSNIDRYMTYAAFITALLSLDFLAALENKKRYALIAIFFLLFAPNALQTSLLHASRTPTSQTPEYIVSMWLKDNTNKEDVIAAAPTPVYAGLSERRQLICEPFFLIPWLYEGSLVKGRFSDFLSLYTSPSQDLLKKYNIRYFVFGNREKEYLKSYSTTPYDFDVSWAFKKVFSTENGSVYELVNITALPPAQEKKLAFEKHSRWWTVTERKDERIKALFVNSSYDFSCCASTERRGQFTGNSRAPGKAPV